MWDEWLSNSDHCRDTDGPDGRLQLYVRTDTQVIEDDVYTKGKAVRRGDKMVKKASEDAITAMRRWMQTGLDDVGEAMQLILIICFLELLYV